jgi:hypothetical protein
VYANGTEIIARAKASVLHSLRKKVQSNERFAIGHRAPAISSPIARRINGSSKAIKTPSEK